MPAFYGISPAARQSLKSLIGIGNFSESAGSSNHLNLRSCVVHVSFARVHQPAKHPVLEATMKRHTLISTLLAGAALAVLGGCASYDDYDHGYRGGAYYGGGYYEPDYYGPAYYGGAYYGGGRAYAPRGGADGGAHREHHDGDHDGARGDGDHREFHRGDNDGNRNFSRNQPQQNAQPAQHAPQQATSSGGGSNGSRSGQDGGGSQSGNKSSGGSSNGGSSNAGPSGSFGHPGTPNNPL
jgi:hypothetical protein